MIILDKGGHFTSFLVTFAASGGEQKSHVVSGASHSFTIDNLRESSAYKVQVSAMVGKREGSPVLVTARTCESRPLLSCFLRERFLTFLLMQPYQRDVYVF